MEEAADTALVPVETPAEERGVLEDMGVVALFVCMGEVDAVTVFACVGEIDAGVFLACVEAAGAVTIADFPAVEVTATYFSVTAGEGIATLAPQFAQVGFLSFPRSKK